MSYFLCPHCGGRTDVFSHAGAQREAERLGVPLLRHIRVASKQKLKDRLMAAVDHFNRHPVVRTWTYNLDRAAVMIRSLETMY
jgi:NUBPL iron-transfer P-loop NTPase